MQHSHPRHYKATTNVLNIKERQIEGQQWVHTWKPMVKFLGASQKFFANFSKYWSFPTKQFTRLLEFIKLYKQNPLDIFFLSFSLKEKLLPKLYFGFIIQSRDMPWSHLHESHPVKATQWMAHLWMNLIKRTIDIQEKWKIVKIYVQSQWRCGYLMAVTCTSTLPITQSTLWQLPWI